MLLLTLLLLALQNDATFRSEVNLVHVDAEVIGQGHVVENLRKEDFRITDNGKAREILYLGEQDEPLDMILLFDTSLSMRPVVERVSRASRTALAELRTGDRVAVMAFAARINLVADFTEDLGAVEKTIEDKVLNRAFRFGSPIQKAVDDAARHFIGQPKTNRRRAVLVITDNQGTNRDRAAVSDFWEADAVLAGLIVANGTTRILLGPCAFGRCGINGIAEQTGGDTLKADDAGTGFREMIHRLRRRYSLLYAMPQGKPGEQRKIKVELTGAASQRNPNAQIRARSGYIVPKN
jgi:VWFA-related protein